MSTRALDRHPSLGLRLPPVIVRLMQWMDGDAKRMRRACDALGASYFAEWVNELTLGESATEHPGELGYHGHPFEVIPLLWQGGDGLQFALLVHADAAELVHPMVSYAPVDDCGPRWLGDDTASGLANLLAVSIRDCGRTPAWAHASEAEIAEVRAETHAHVAELAAALGVDIPAAAERLTPGARSDRPAIPRVPEGWLFEECNDDVGVLAPAVAFVPPETATGEVTLFDLEAEMANVGALLARGAPASALAVARNVYRYTAFDTDAGRRGALGMREAYAALGRDMLMQRVDDYLRTLR
jgi:hypothetical protein